MFKYQSAFVIAVLLASRFSLAADTHTELVMQVQAADLLSDLLTWTADRADSRVRTMTEYLRTIGKADEFAKRPQAVANAKPLFYSQLFAGAVQFVKGEGAGYADPQ